MVIDDGDRAGMLRCQALLEELGVETVRDDPHESFPYFLEVSDVSCMVYTQDGHNTQKAGCPDWMFVDTMWDKL